MFIEQLKERLNSEMENLSQSPYLAQVMEPGFADKRLYAIYMCETYHYTLHNSKNQALVATRDEGIDVRYAKFCLKHALEEVGHEFMALHDMKALGIEIEVENLPRPLSSTQVLISYLYRASTELNPMGRLGYSFWAERVYDYIRPLLGLMGEGLGIPKKATTFFNEHADIDEQHAVDVDKAIESFVKTEQERQAVIDTMVTSLKLSAQMLDEVFEEFVKVKNGQSTRYEFLNQLEV